MIKAPEGMEFTVVAYLISDSTKIKTKIILEGLGAIVDNYNAHDLLKSLDIDLRTHAPDLRPMTRNEISEFKATMGPPTTVYEKEFHRQ